MPGGAHRGRRRLQREGQRTPLTTLSCVLDFLITYFIANPWLKEPCSLYLLPASAPPSRPGLTRLLHAFLPVAPCCAGGLYSAHANSSVWAPAVYGGAHQGRRRLQGEEQCAALPFLSGLLDFPTP